MRPTLSVKMSSPGEGETHYGLHGYSSSRPTVFSVVLDCAVEGLSLVFASALLKGFGWQ